jgi:hypothetical protein
MDNVIRNGINFGGLVIAELDGVRFAIDVCYADSLALTYTAPDGEFPAFNTELHISIVFPKTGQSIYNYAFDNADVRKIAIALSLFTGNDIRVVSAARFLATYNEGKLIGEIRPLASFYSGLTEDQIAASTF